MMRFSGLLPTSEDLALFPDFRLQLTKGFVEDIEQPQGLTGNPEGVFNDGVKHNRKPGFGRFRDDTGYLFLVQLVGQILQLPDFFLNR